MKTLLLVAAIFTCAAADAAVYQIQDLGVLPPVGALYAINASGQAVGAQGGAFLYTPGSGMQVLLGGFSASYAISDSGKVTGVYYPYDANKRLFLYDSGTGVTYPSLPSSASAFGINNAGTISGDYRASDGKQHAFVYTPGVGMTDYASLLGSVSSYSGRINDAGDVAGTYEPQRGVLYLYTYSSGSGASKVGSLGFYDLRVSAINNLGQIAGYGWYDGTMSHMHAYLYTPGGGATDLGVDTKAYGLNDLGQVVGLASTSPRAFVYTPGLGNSYLPTLGAGDSIAYHIDNSGRIVGTSYDDAGNLHVVAWNPIPEPSSLLALAACIGAFGMAARMRKR